MLYASHVHQPIEERAGSEHHSTGSKRYSQSGGHSPHPTLLDDKAHHGILPNVELWLLVEDSAPVLHEAHAVGLGSWAPHRRPLAAVEHAELDGRAVGDDAHHATKRIYLPHNLSLSDTTDGRIAAHLRNLVHVMSDEQSVCSHARSSTSRFTTGMAGTNHNDVVAVTHGTMK